MRKTCARKLRFDCNWRYFIADVSDVRKKQRSIFVRRLGRANNVRGNERLSKFLFFDIKNRILFARHFIWKLLITKRGFTTPGFIANGKKCRVNIVHRVQITATFSRSKMKKMLGNVYIGANYILTKIEFEELYLPDCVVHKSYFPIVFSNVNEVTLEIF